MAVATEAQAGAGSASPAVRARQSRRREEELLVWPDLVFIEFISAVLFTLTLTILSIVINAPLQDRANPANTPNPSKAPWYFLNLQELLLHMHPALAGVIVPTVALIALGAIPYFDTDNDRQGEWLTTPRAWPNLIWGSVVGVAGTALLIGWDSQRHVLAYERITGSAWPGSLEWFRSARSLQGEIAEWLPSSWSSIPLGENVLRTDLLGLPAIDLNVNLPAVLIEQVLPVTLMVGLPILLSLVAWRTGLARTKRDHMILQFAGFIAVFIALTVSGTVFRGEGMDIFWPWEVSPAES
jgi:quinol-cytochrome oxidoreductase complex cytochrome b subunit